MTGSPRQSKWSSDAVAELDTFYSCIFLIPPKCQFSTYVIEPQDFKKGMLQRKENIIYPRRLPQSYCTISLMLLCQTCSYTTCLWKEKLTVLSNTIFTCSYGFCVRSGTIFPASKLSWLSEIWTKQLCDFLLLSLHSPVAMLDDTGPRSSLKQLQFMSSIRFLMLIYNSQCLSSQLFLACSPAVWEIWSCNVVFSGSLFQCVSENLKNCWAESCALELAHTEGKKLWDLNFYCLLQYENFCLSCIIENNY